MQILQINLKRMFSTSSSEFFFSLAYVRSIVSTIVKVEGDGINQSVLTPIYTLVSKNTYLISIIVNTVKMNLVFYS